MNPIQKLTEDLAVIQKLGDNPNSDNNLTADELKEKFDYAALAIQKYLNSVVDTLNSIFGDEQTAYLLKSGGTMSGPINMNGQPITGLNDPVGETDAVPKSYVVAKKNLRKLAYSQLDANGNVNLNTITAYPTSPGVYRVGSAGDMPVPGEWGNLIIFDTGYVTHIFENFDGIWVQQTEDQYAVTLDGWKKLSSLDDNHPVGSIYLSTQSTSPASLFGGTWEQIKDRFLLAAGDTYSAGSTGGEAIHTLTISEMPSHKHDFGSPLSGNPTSANQLAINWGDEAVRTQDYLTETLPTGGNEAHNNMPPYLAVNIWMRVA